MVRQFGFLLTCAVAALPAFGNVYTSSTAYGAATAGYVTVINETYGTLSVGDIPTGTTLDGITYSNFTGTFTDADITNQYNSFTGNSLGADHTGGDPTSTQTFFYGTEGLSATFSSPVYAAGVFFNVNANSGNYGFTTSSGDTASTGSGSYDVGTFVFAGITSATPFTSITLFSTSVTTGVYNVSEIEAATTPEPSFYALMGIGLTALLLGRRFRSAR